MKYVLLIFLLGCSSIAPYRYQKEGMYFVAGCSIYDLKGEVVRSYPGQFCIFRNDGSFVTYDGPKMELTKYDRNMKKAWVLKTHIHHGIEVTEQGDLLTQSSIVKSFMGIKRVRFDVALKISQEGKIIGKFLWENHLNSLLPSWGPFRPYEIRENRELNLKHEITHQASSYELQEELVIGEKIIPKGSILATLNGLGSGVYIFDKDLTKILYSSKVPLSYLFHDAQQFSSKEIIYFKNSIGMKPNSSFERAWIMVYDLEKQHTTSEIGYKYDFSGTVQGGIQRIDQDTILISDYINDPSISYPELQIENPTKPEMRDFHSKRKSRVTFYSLSQRKPLYEIRFPFIQHKVRLEDLRNFLQKNVGL